MRETSRNGIVERDTFSGYFYRSLTIGRLHHGNIGPCRDESCQERTNSEVLLLADVVRSGIFIMATRVLHGYSKSDWLLLLPTCSFCR